MSFSQSLVHVNILYKITPGSCSKRRLTCVCGSVVSHSSQRSALSQKAQPFQVHVTCFCLYFVNPTRSRTFCLAHLTRRRSVITYYRRTLSLTDIGTLLVHSSRAQSDSCVINFFSVLRMRRATTSVLLSVALEARTLLALPGCRADSLTRPRRAH